MGGCCEARSLCGWLSLVMAEAPESMWTDPTGVGWQRRVRVNQGRLPPDRLWFFICGGFAHASAGVYSLSACRPSRRCSRRCSLSAQTARWTGCAGTRSRASRRSPSASRIAGRWPSPLHDSGRDRQVQWGRHCLIFDVCVCVWERWGTFYKQCFSTGRSHSCFDWVTASWVVSQFFFCGINFCQEPSWQPLIYVVRILLTLSHLCVCVCVIVIHSVTWEVFTEDLDGSVPFCVSDFLVAFF